MGQRGRAGRALAMGQRCCGAALTALCRGAAAVLGCPGFPRAHALLLGALVAAGPLLRGRGDPHSVLASPHNRLEARLTSSAAAWTWLLIGSLLVASQPWLRPPWGGAARAALRLAVGLGLARAGPALGRALEAATGSCRQATPLGTLLLPLGDPARCRGAGHRWEGFGPAPQAFALVHCGLGLAEEAAALGRSLYGRGKMAAGRGAGEEECKMAAGYGLRGESKMAARYGLGEESKMAARYGLEEESKMAARYGLGEESKMAERYGAGEGSKMVARFKMAAGYGLREESKMAAGYGVEQESKMASRSKMAAGYGAGEESKMAASSGWGWPRPIWRPTWAEPPRTNHGWGGHLGQPHAGGGHFERRSGGHFDGRSSPHEGGHFEGRHGGHFEHGGGHFEHRGGHFERRGGHFDHGGGHFELGRFPPRSHLPGGHLEHPFQHPAGHFDRPGGHFEPRHGGFSASPRPNGGGHLGEAPPAALSLLYLLALALLVTWHFLLVVTLTYRDTWARNAAGAALGWAAWAVTYRGWYRRPWSPGPPGWG